MIMKFFTYLGITLSDPSDQQGSTKRLCLFIFMLNVMALVSYVTLKLGKLPDIPDSFAALAKFIVISLVGAVTIDRGIAGAVAYKSGSSGSSDGSLPVAAQPPPPVPAVVEASAVPAELVQ